MIAILAIAAYTALVWFIVKVIKFCTKDERKE